MAENEENTVKTTKLRELIREEMRSKNMERYLDVRAFALSWGITLTILMAILLLWNAFTPFGTDFIRLYETLHPNGSLSSLRDDGGKWAGFVINLIYGFIDGVIFGALIAFFNNRMVWLFSPLRKKKRTKK